MSESILQIIEQDGELLVDSRLVAAHLGIAWEIFEYVCDDLYNQPMPFLSRFELLAVAQRASYLDINFDKIFDLVDKIFYPHMIDRDTKTFVWLKHSVLQDVCDNFRVRTSEDGRVTRWFMQQYTQLFEGAKLLPVVARQGKRPDLLLEYEGFVIPVECKLSFNSRSLKQLQGYMKLWNSPKGIAIAPKYAVDLPQDIIQWVCP